MIDFSGLLGNESVKRTVNSCGGCRSWIIEGPQGSGRHTLADILVRAYLCQGRGTKPCGVCEGCFKTAARSHPDLTVVPSDIKIADLRDILADLAVYPSQGDYKIYVLEDADKLGTLQQNALLKSLEEPPEFVVFVLICGSASDLLPTVASRCVRLTMSPLSVRAVRAELGRSFPNADPRVLDRAADQSGGLIGRAVRELRDGDPHPICMDVALAIAQARYSDALTLMLELKSKRSEFNDMLQGTAAIFKTCACICARGASEPRPKYAAVRDLGLKKLCSLVDVFGKVFEKTEYNINITLWSALLVKECEYICEGKEQYDRGCWSPL